MGDLIRNYTVKNFYVWINPNDFIANNNSKANQSLFQCQLVTKISCLSLILILKEDSLVPSN